MAHSPAAPRPTTMTRPVQDRPLAEVSDAEALAIGTMLASVWPKPGKGPQERAAQLQGYGAGYDGPRERGPVSHIAYAGDKVAAHALTFCRVVAIDQGELPVMALAMVAADPTHRGEGLGAAVARAAFARVDEGVFPCSLFQTSFAVRPFYERLGCVLVENRIVNSHNEGDPGARPFWDDVVMRYPGDGPWPAGEIDLRGRGY